MKLELKTVKINKSMSEETTCFSAYLFMDGKKVAHVANRGTGGCDEVHWLDLVAAETISAAFQALPEERDAEFDFAFQPDLEMWCARELEAIEAVKLATKNRGKKVAIIHNNDILSFSLPPEALSKPSKTGGTLRDELLRKYPGASIVNEMTNDQVRAALEKSGVLKAQYVLAEIDIPAPKM